MMNTHRYSINCCNYKLIKSNINPKMAKTFEPAIMIKMDEKSY